MKNWNGSFFLLDFLKSFILLHLFILLIDVYINIIMESIQIKLLIKKKKNYLDYLIILIQWMKLIKINSMEIGKIIFFKNSKFI